MGPFDFNVERVFGWFGENPISVVDWGKLEREFWLLMKRGHEWQGERRGGRRMKKEENEEDDGGMMVLDEEKGFVIKS